MIEKNWNNVIQKAGIKLLVLVWVLVSPLSFAAPEAHTQQPHAIHSNAKTTQKPAVQVARPSKENTPQSHSQQSHPAQEAHVVQSVETKKVLEKPQSVELEPELSLGQITRSTDKPKSDIGLGQQEFFRVYSGLIFVLGMILLALWLLRRSPWFSRLKSSIGVVSETTSHPEKNKDFYQLQIMHRTRLGPGKELLTVYQAGQWLLLGVTAQQVNLVAKFDDFHSNALPDTLSQDSGFKQIYEKYVEPIAKNGVSADVSVSKEPTSSLIEESSNSPNLAQSVESQPDSTPTFTPQFVSATQGVSQPVDEDYEEIQMKDFEDWYDGPLISAKMPKQS